MVISEKYDSWSKKMCGRRSCSALTKDSDLKMLRLVFQIKIRSRTYSMVFWYNMRFQLWVIRTLLYTVCVHSVFTHSRCSVLWPLTPSIGLTVTVTLLSHWGNTWSGNDSDSQTPIRVKASSYNKIRLWEQQKRRARVWFNDVCRRWENLIIIRTCSDGSLTVWIVSASSITPMW